MSPTCGQCPKAINAINGRYCKLLKQYVQHQRISPCGVSGTLINSPK